MAVLRDALGAVSDPAFVDWYDGDEAYLVVVDLPGVATEDVRVRVDRGRLDIDARRRKAEVRDHEVHVENRSISADVELPLPPDATDQGASAAMDRGVLEIRLPKRSATDTTTIPVGE